METFVLWLSFVGAWLLFAGPITQAVLELREQDIEEERIKSVASKIEKPPKVSGWWWLLPPVKIFLERRRSDAYRKLYLKELLPEDAEAVIAFINKATSWSFVALGGFCIAIKETYELTVHMEWNNLVLLLIVLFMLLISILNVKNRVKRSVDT